MLIHLTQVQNWLHKSQQAQPTVSCLVDASVANKKFLKRFILRHSVVFS